MNEELYVWLVEHLDLVGLSLILIYLLLKEYKRFNSED